MFFEELKNFDPEVYAPCERELNRQRGNIELIASEGDLTANAEYAAVSSFLGEASYDELIALYDKVMG